MSMTPQVFVFFPEKGVVLCLMIVINQFVKFVLLLIFMMKDLNIMIIETILMNNNGERLHEWLVEAVCARSLFERYACRGLLAEETH